MSQYRILLILVKLLINKYLNGQYAVTYQK